MTQDFFNLGLARRDPEEEARFLSLQRVRGYWEGLIGPGGALPCASELDPRGLLPALEDVFLADRIGNGLLRLRIAGRRVSAPAGMDMQGLPLSALFLAAARPALAEVVERVCNLNCLVTMELQGEAGLGRAVLRARLLLLPLADPQHGQPSVLGCLSTVGEIGRTPRRFAVTGVVEERLGQRIKAASAAPTRKVSLQDFAETDLSQANLSRANLSRADLSPVKTDKTRFELAEEAGAFAPQAHLTENNPEPAEEGIVERPKLRLVHSSD